MAENIVGRVFRWNLSARLGGIGLFLIGVAALLFAASYAGLLHRRNKDVPPWEMFKPIEHSFEVVQLGEMRRDQFLYDKKSGRIWEKVCSGKPTGADCDGMLVWEEMYVAGITPQDSEASMLYNFQVRQQLEEAAKKKPVKK